MTLTDTLTDTMTGQPLTGLPFVKMRRDAPNMWHVAPTHDYAKACKLGREYAATLAAYMHDNPASAAVLTHVVAAMDHADQSPTKGYRVGFLAHVGHMMSAAGEGAFAGLYRENLRHAGAMQHDEA